MRGGIMNLGKGRLSGACLVGDECVMVLRRGDALYKKRLLPGRKIIDEGVIGYETDCYLFGEGKLTFDSEVSYEVTDQ